MNILYVEDNEVNQALVGRVCRAKRHKVVFCEEGEEALAHLAAKPELDLILLDIELAGAISGLDVIKAMRARNDNRPVVAITAYAMMGDRERILAAGCDQYLPKPLVITDLLALMDEYEADIEARKAAVTPEAAPTPPPTLKPDVLPTAPLASTPEPAKAPEAVVTPVPQPEPAAPEPVVTPVPQPEPATPEAAATFPAKPAPAAARAPITASEPEPATASEVAPTPPVTAPDEPDTAKVPEQLSQAEAGVGKVAPISEPTPAKPDTVASPTPASESAPDTVKAAAPTGPKEPPGQAAPAGDKSNE